MPTISHSVTTIEHLSFIDSVRKKNIDARVSFPADGSNYPVVIFSHGAGASKDDYLALTHHWASNGYMVIQPTHADSLAERQSRGLPADLPHILMEARKDYKGWINRCRDISATIDYLPILNSTHADLTGKLAPDAVAVAGHSYGAYTTYLLGGAHLQLPDWAELNNLADPRIRCIIAMSPPGTGQQGLVAESFASIKLPMLLMTGSRDKGMSGQPAQWRTEGFYLCSPGDKYLVFIEGATHFSFAAGRATLIMNKPGHLEAKSATKLSGISGPKGLVSKLDQRAILGFIKEASLTYLNAYMRHDDSSLAHLRSARLPESSHGLVNLQIR